MWLGPRLLRGCRAGGLFGLALTGSGLLLFPLALVQQLEIVTVIALLLGFFAGAAWVTGNTLLGLEVPDEIRGRTFAFVGSMVRLVARPGAGHRAAARGPDRRRTPRDLRRRAGLQRRRVDDPDRRRPADRRRCRFLSSDGRPERSPAGDDLRNAFVGTPGVYSATGLFIALEGGEGAGKSTQSDRLAAWLREEGYDVLLTHEPGDTEIGQKLRRIVLDPATGDISHRAEALLYAADKAEHVDRVVAPALERGAVVVTDRYVDSTLAYQGAGRDLSDREVERVARWATADLRPHLTVLLDLPPQTGLTRFEERDRIEGESVEFHERVRQAFLRLAAADPQHYLVIDARRPIEEIAAVVRERVEPLLEQAVRGPARAGQATPAAAHQTPAHQNPGPPAPSLVDRDASAEVES